MQELIKALAQARLKFKPVVKTATARITSKRTGNTHSYRYATLDDLLEATVPALSEHELVVTFSTEILDNRFVLNGKLWHSSGQLVDAVYPLPSMGEDPKLFGSALTYGRRYLYSCLLNIAAEEDDDGTRAGEVATKPPAKSQQFNAPKPANSSSDEPLTREQLVELEALRESLGIEADVVMRIAADMGYPKVQQMPQRDFGALKTHIQGFAESMKEVA